MKKWKKWRLSKYRFPTFQVKGSGATKGANIVGRTAAIRFLESQLGSERVKQMVQSDTRTEWVFAEPL